MNSHLQLDKDIPIIHGVCDHNEEVHTDDVTHQGILVCLAVPSHVGRG